MKRLILFLAVLLAAFAAPSLRAETVSVIRLRGPIGPATAEYIDRGLREARAKGSQCLVMELDTPGGLLESTKHIVQDLFASPVPTVIYVTPSGATATSAGCFITLAADFAVMAPSTTIGAAHPVEIGSSGGAEKMDDTMKTKLENYATSYIEMIATKRHHNVEWARSAVKDSASITSEKALEMKVIDFTARDMADLLAKLDGREVNGVKLKTAGAMVIEVPMSWRELVFQKLWTPEVMFLLMLAAIYGIIGELSSPGVILPGVLGSIALILALYMSAVLPVSVAGLALIAVALVFFTIDLYAPTHGVLTGGGIIAFFVGSLMLFDRNDPVFRLSLAYIIPAALLTAAFFVFVLGKGLQAQRMPVKVGRETLLGRIGKAMTPISSAPGGQLFVDGETWNAISAAPIAPGSSVEIESVDGLTLRVFAV